MALARKLTVKIYEIKAHTEKVTCLDLGETGRVLVTGGQDRNVNLWAIGEEKCFMSLTGHNGGIDCVRFAYNDDFVYSADDIGIIRRWDLNAQTICSTLNGHMKSVKTLDFNPSGEYVVSGSNDTTVRLWDVRNQNKCIKKYRGHVGYVNSVKFSPDGLWIASAGAEGSIIIWDIRESKQIAQFTERSSPVTCIQFHPFEFLLAAGRQDGTVCLYDLENMQLISKTDKMGSTNGHSVKCIMFSDNGECLFVGTAAGISVIGWEPDREFDHVESTWTNLGDMKICKRKLICGSYEKENVSINALSIDRVFPFYNPSNTPFSHNQSSRKSFSRGSQKIRLSIGTNSTLKPHDEIVESGSSIEGGLSSPSLSIEMVDEPLEYPKGNNGMSFSYLGTSKVDPYYMNANIYPKDTVLEGPSSLKMPGEPDLYRFDKHANSFTNDLDYYPLDNSTHIISNYDEAEKEDFTVNSAQQPDYAPKMGNAANAKLAPPRSRPTVRPQRRTSPTGHKPPPQRKLSNMTSLSTVDLHKMEYSSTTTTTTKRQTNQTNSKLRRQDSLQNKENNQKDRNITVQIITKPPTRSKTALDLRAPPRESVVPKANRISYTTDDTSEIQMLSSYHEQIYQELSNRYATLQLIRNSTKSQDIVGALKQSLKISGRSVFVDLLGAILEKTSTWNLDMCLLLLPEIYELLQSQHKFHYNRACDTLRVILSNFLPTIQENIDPWSAGSLGVDITREERQRKCVECQQWLLRIRMIPENHEMGSTLTQLQNMIVGI